MRLAHSAGPDIPALVKDCSQQLGDAKACTLAFLYVTDALADRLPLLLAELKLTTGIPHWTGSVGMALNLTGEEIYDRPAIVVLAMEIPEETFRILPLIKAHPETPLKPLQPWLMSQDRVFSILHGDPGNPLTPDLIEELPRWLPPATLVGGITSSQSEPWQIADQPLSGGISGVLFSDQCCIRTAHTQGCEPIGPSHTITRCERNIIIELDGRPALGVLKEDIGEILSRNLSKIAGYIFAALPITESEDGDYMVRNIIGLDESQQLIAIGERIEEGDELLFTRRDSNSAQNDLRRMLEELKQSLPGPAKGGIYFSCLGRGRYMFGEESAEMSLIKEHLGDIPIVGFQANGEIFQHNLYGFTGVLSVFC
jgi:small ligand-binding sensory domain FIST